MKKRYGLTHFIFDLVMTSATGGLWLIYLVFKALRRNN